MKEKLELWESVYMKFGLPTLLVAFGLGVFSGYIKSPLATAAQVEIISKDMKEHALLEVQKYQLVIGVVRQVCRNTAKTDYQLQQCDR